MPMTLPEYITAHLTKPFKWGANDCCTFIGAWVQIKTGRDYLTEHKPWRTARQAAKKLKELGGIRGLFQSNLKEIHPKHGPRRRHHYYRRGRKPILWLAHSLCW